MNTLRHRTARRDLVVRLRPTAWAARLLLGGALAGVLPVGAQTSTTQNPPRVLPNPCAVTLSCGPATAPITNFVGSGSATVQVNGSTMTIRQQSDTSLLNWRTFDIAAGNTVNFSREGTAANPNPGFVSINRIHDTQASRIDGNLNAPNGQVYLLNSNGILFGSGANVDVGGLIASSLAIDPRRIDRGLLGTSAITAAFSLDEANAEAANARVTVGAGAVIRAGSVMLFAPRVDNEGSIQVTPGGQVVLAAGQRVFMTGSDSATLRGLLVEVGQGGTVTNSGEILTPRGNTTLVGMAVRQDGRITATSALNENGSIRLVAREVASGTTTTAQLLSARPPEAPFTATFATVTDTGAVSVGSGSQTVVALDRSDTATAALNDANAAAARSTITVDGARVSIGGASERTTLLQARGGDITVSARAPSSAIVGRNGQVLGIENAAASLGVGADARLDVSGERDVAVDGARNFVFIERLTSNDLRDAPAQRDGFLLGQGVHVNVAQAHPFIDTSGRQQAVAGTQAERNASGGTIALRAEGRVDVAQGAQFDLSGGSTVTSQATGRTSQLVTPDGRIVDIMQASATGAYVGFADRATVTLDAPREGLQQSRAFDAPRLTTVGGFTEGKAGGTLEIIAPRGSFGGRVTGDTVVAPRQRGNEPAGAQLVVGRVAGAPVDTLDQQAELSRANVLLTNDLANAAAQVPADQQDRLLAIDTSVLREGRIGRVAVVSDGAITVTRGADIDAGPLGSVSLLGNQVQVGASLSAAGGSITVGERPASGQSQGTRDALNLVAAGERGDVRFGAGVVLDVAGRFTNDSVGFVGGTTPVRNGGSISITGRDVDVGDVAAFRLDAGASVSSTGALAGGSGGSLTLRATDVQNLAVTDADAGRLVLGAGFAERVSAFGFGGAGRLTLGAPRLAFGAGADPAALTLDDALFARGFSSYAFAATDALTIGAGVRLAPQVAQYTLQPSLRHAADGSALSQLLVPAMPLPAARRPQQLSFSASRPLGQVDVGTGAVLDVGASGSVSLTAGGAIHVDGTLAAAGGSVSLQLTELSTANFTALSLEQAERRAVQVGEHARLDVSGVSRVVEDAQGRRSGSVLDGGSLSLNAAQGHLAVHEGAVLRADGTSDLVDIAQGSVPQRTEVATRGGSVSLAGMLSLNVNGSVSAHAGGAGVEGGRLSVRMDGLNRTNRDELVRPGADVYDAAFRADRVLTLGGDAVALPSSGDRFDSATYAGRGRVGAALLGNGGFDTVWLASTNTIAAPNSLALDAGASLTLDAQALSLGPDALLSLNAPVVSLGFGAGTASFAPNESAAASGGTSRLEVQARSIDLVGQSVLQGTGSALLAARDDLRLRSPDASGNRFGGSFTVAGDLQISAAQVTPATQTDFTLALVDRPDALLSIAPSGQAPLEPLSAAGRVTLTAPEVRIDGRVTAPHGAIIVRGSERVTVGPQAVLSVAGHQELLYGTVFNGSQWTYGDDPNVRDTDIASPSGVSVIDKKIDIEGRVVDVAPGARLDLSAGGELVAHEFVAGPGGSVDLRQNLVPTAPGAATTQRNPVFALVPARGDAAAPVDPQATAGLSFDAGRGGSNVFRYGQTITVGAGSGIPPGTYTVLPARYALLPGAFAVEPVTGYADLSPTRALQEASGTVIVAGRLGMDGAGASTARWSGYRVYTQAQFARRAEWRRYEADRFFDAAAAAAGTLPVRTAEDAGGLSLAADAVRWGGTIVADHGSGGRGAQVALSAPQMTVTDQPVPAADTPSAQWTLNAGTLSALDAETLVLGATATRGGDGALTLSRVAGSVGFGGTQALRAGEVVLTARDSVTVGAGAEVSAAGASVPTTTRLALEGDGALLLVSQGPALPAIARSGATGASGDLRVDAGARLAGDNVLFDASGRQQYSPSSLVDAERVGLSAFAVNLGDVPAGTAGLNLDNALLARLGSVQGLTLTSGSGFQLYGDVEAGGAALASLTLDGGALVNRTAGATARFTAGRVELRNGGAAATPADAAAGGTLLLQATDGPLVLGAGSVALAGFDSVTLSATQGELRMAGSGRLDAGAADLTLAATRIGSAAGADHTLATTGVLRTAATAADTAPAGSAGLGGVLALEGRRVEHAGRIVLPSGSVTLRATGADAADGVTLAAGSRIDVSGITQTFATQQADTSAGRIALRSEQGSVAAQAGSTLALAGAGVQGDAGTLVLAAANGSVALDGSVDATAGSAARAGTLAVDAGRLPDLGAVARAADADAWQRIELRVRRGDATLAAGDRLRGATILLALDGADAPTQAQDGRLTLAGTLDAGGERGGRIEVHARDQLALASTARLSAASTGAAHEGGTVLLAARVRDGLAADAPLDAITITEGARVDVAGPAGGGTVTLRAPRVGDDVAIGALPAGFASGARQEIVEATVVSRNTGNLVLSTTAPASAANPLPTLRTTLQGYMSDANRTAMTDRLGRTGDDAFHLRPGLEITTTGNLTVNGAVDFTQQSGSTFAWRYGGTTIETSEPGALTLRAGGDLTLTGGLTDGFTLTGALNTTGGRLLPFAQGDSWRYQLTGGADLAAAAPSAVKSGAASGDVIVQPSGATTNPAQLRTGTGRIDVAAARDIVLRGNNVAVFTGGEASVAGPAFENTAVQGLNPNFTQHGGDVTLEAGRDITANAATQLVSNWLWRVGRHADGDFGGSTNAPSAWWVNAATFTQGAGALGGGDVDVRAGRNVTSLSTSVAGNGFLDAASGRVVEHNAGDLSVQAGGQLAGGVHHAQTGALELRAESIGARSTDDPLVVAQGGNRARLQARGDIALYGAFNPTLAPSLTQFTQGALLNTPANAVFSTYGPDSALSVRSLVGDVVLGGQGVSGQARVSQQASSTLVSSSPASRTTLFTVLPGTVDLVSFGGDVALAGSRWMAPAERGQLRLLADGSVRGGTLAMMDLDPAPAPTDGSAAALPSASAPISMSALDTRMRAGGSIDGYNLNATARHRTSPTPLHADDPDAVAVVARTGDLLGLQLDVPKPAEVTVAGNIASGTTLRVQNTGADSLTRIHAGGRIDFTATGGSADDPAVQVGGPGTAEVLAGRGIDLGSGGGIVSRGNLNNTNLPEGGATLVVMSGLGRGADGFVQRPDFAGVLLRFVADDAFAASGSAADGLNADVLQRLAARGVDVAPLRAALADRAAARAEGSAFRRWLDGLDEAARLRVSLGVVEQVQAVANERFVATANTDTFSPGYAVLQNLFPTLADAGAGLRAFVATNPFAVASNAAALREDVLAALPADTAALLRRGLAGDSAGFETGLAALSADERARAGRELLAATQRVAGAELERLRAGGRVDAGVGTPFAGGLDTLARAFAPAGAAGTADISLVFSQIKAEQSGDVVLMAPQGGVLVGLANPPAGAAEKQPYQLGILTLGGGSIAGTVRDNFDVFRSRVFTTAGGDIHLWSSLGNIDAGRGPRDVAVAPPPRLVIDENGVVSLDVTASVSGSGIGALKTREEQPPSAIRLIAPNGFIDAGEAGIRADSGTVTLGTNVVLNAGNISAGSGVAGGAVVVAPPAPVPTSTSTAAADKAVEQTQKALTEEQKDTEERARRERRKRVTGEFIGFGED